MENQVFERDYAKEFEHIRKLQNNDHADRVFQCARDTGFWEKFNKAMKSVPRVVNPNDKETYETLLPVLNMIARQHGGKIKGIIDYERWEAHIYLTLPFIEFYGKRSRELLSYIAERAGGITFSVENGMIRMSILIDYFIDCCDSGEMMEDALAANEELSSLLDEADEAEIQGILQTPEIMKYVTAYCNETGEDPEEFIRCLALGFNEHPEAVQKFLLEKMMEAEPYMEDESSDKE